MTPIIITLTITAIAAIAAMAIIAVGHQTEERPGTIDLTGINFDPGPSYELREAFRRRLASRVRAEASARSCLSAMGGIVEVETYRDPIGVVLELRTQDQHSMRRAVLSDVEAYDVGAALVRLSELPETELAAAAVPLGSVPVVVDARMPRDVAAMVGDGVVDVFRVSDGAHVARTTLGELAGQPRGDEAA